MSRDLFSIPGFYCLHRTLHLVLSAIGGLIGLYYSRLDLFSGGLFLIAVVSVVAIFAAAGYR